MLLILLTALAVPSVWGGIMMSPPELQGQEQGPSPAEVEVIISPEQMQLNARCNGKCFTELCYLDHDEDCRNFITCQRDARGRYHATIQPCAFGTYWAGQKHLRITCDLPQNVRCPINYCGNQPVGSNYPHNDGNCRTYWTCTSKGPEPRCCSDTEYYDLTQNMCVPDVAKQCNHRCPIKQDACLIEGATTIAFDDGNCRTYWDCEDRRPHPVCCPEGDGYDSMQKKCVPNGCADPCPAEYAADACSKPGVLKYPLHDTSCRTYMRCNAVDGDERWCCPSWHVFDRNSQTCIERTPDMDYTCSDECPQGFNEVCHLKPASSPDKYIQVSNNIDIEMACPGGTVFDPAKCGCGKRLKDAPDNSCNMELDILFERPAWQRSGSQRNIEINYNGTIKDGPALNGRTSYLFDGGLLFRVAFFQQSLPNLYINIIYNPTSASPTKQILLSNCNSLELYLENGRIFLALMTDNMATGNAITPVSTSVAYSPNVWNQYTAVYNGQDVYVLNDGGATPSFDMRSLTGQISVAAEGLDIGGCNMNQGQGQGFQGALGQLQFSKCLKQPWIDEFNAATAGLQTNP